MHKILLTGASGLIGRQTLSLLLNQGHEVHAVARSAPHILHKNLHWHPGDLLSTAFQTELFRNQNFTHLLHFAWITEHGEFWHSLENHDWVKASTDLLKLFHHSGGRRFIGAGTCAEYTWNSDIYDELQTETKSEFIYGQCKNQFHTTLSDYCNKHELSYAWGRIFYPFGPYENSRRLIPSVIRSLLLNTEVACSDGLAIKDFLYSKDVASAFTSILSSTVTGPINIGSGQSMSVKTLVTTIANKMNKLDLVHFGKLPARTDEPASLVPALKRLNNEVGWAPQYTLESALDETISYWSK